MTNVKSKAFTQLSDLIKFMNTIEVGTVISLMHDDDSNAFIIIYQT